ncbi:hypothetical protein SEF58_08495 [Neomoorella humiferrea]|uniref:Yip1 domain protein n=1 Tax=Neomoorella humiferrea TaxID=676965 RepID=A0A2T0AYX9_9FIRM|nr:hypothetical protein [Moorella humiferrea]PRR76211.1 hypothetical protein MOHU_00550 [Moorella humiferrea]
MVLAGLAGPIVFLAGLILMLLVVPWERVKELALVGLVGGLALAFLVIYLMQNYFGFWAFRRVDLINVGGIPLFLAASWFPLIIVFSHLLAQYKNIMPLLLILLAFPLGATLLHLLLRANGMLFYRHWNLPLTFILSLGIHLVIMAYLYAAGMLDNLRGLNRTPNET